jgi:hypothetical protein
MHIFSLAYEFFLWWKYYILVYENGKMRPVETIPGMGGGSKFYYDIL